MDGLWSEIRLGRSSLGVYHRRAFSDLMGMAGPRVGAGKLESIFFVDSIINGNVFEYDNHMRIMGCSPSC